MINQTVLKLEWRYQGEDPFKNTWNLLDPLRRIVHIDSEPKIDAATCAQALEDHWIPQTNIGVEQFFKIFSLQKPKKVGRLCYTREFLVGLATCPQAMKKPEFLPEHPVVLTRAREPGDLIM